MKLQHSGLHALFARAGTNRYTIHTSGKKYRRNVMLENTIDLHYFPSTLMIRCRPTFMAPFGQNSWQQKQ